MPQQSPPLSLLLPLLNFLIPFRISAVVRRHKSAVVDLFYDLLVVAFFAIEWVAGVNAEAFNFGLCFADGVGHCVFFGLNGRVERSVFDALEGFDERAGGLCSGQGLAALAE